MATRTPDAPRREPWSARIKRRRRLLAVAVALALGAPAALGFLVVAATPLPPELFAGPTPSLRVLSRTGSLLREVRASDGARSRPLALAELSPRARDAILAAEDRRFYSHPGVDPVAVLRALATDLAHQRVVSGASTLTMQLARTLRPHRRTLWGKLREAALALRIEASLPKDRILEEYLNRVSYGPNVRGYASASLAYFGVPPGSLSLAQAALLAGLPRGPALYEVTRHPALAKRRRDRILARMRDAGTIDDPTLARAVAEPVAPSVERPAFGAPHFVEGVVAGRLRGSQPGLDEALSRGGQVSLLTTTIDPELQRAAEVAVTATLAALRDKHVTAAAVVVLGNTTGDVLAYVGSADFWDEAALGQNDGVLALRQPGSSLKPFVYAEAMTTHGFTGATLLPDVEVDIPLPGGGDYSPHDYDGKLRGPVRLREALGNSLNIPAVYTLYQLGTEPVLSRLHAFGFESLTDDAEHYGPALALGDGEVTLLELANAYATLARGGLWRPVRLVTRVERREGPSGAVDAVELGIGPPRRVVGEAVAAMLTDILSDRRARTSAFGDQNVLELDFDVAAKTGTSKGFRDNVAVGYTREVTVAVWAGNFDGSPMAEVSGITGAGPIFRTVMGAAVLDRRGSSHDTSSASLSLAPDAPRLGLARTAVCALSGEPPRPACPHVVYEWLPADDALHAPSCAVHEEVRLDTRNGLRAGPDCPTSVTTLRTFERWRGLYAGWASRVGRPAPPDEGSPECPPLLDERADPVGEAAAVPRDGYPFDGASFLIDPERPLDLQMLEVRVLAEGGSRVDVTVDALPLGRDRRWRLATGEHTLVARSASGVGPSVHIKVR